MSTSPTKTQPLAMRDPNTTPPSKPKAKSPSQPPSASSPSKPLFASIQKPGEKENPAPISNLFQKKQAKPQHTVPARDNGTDKMPMNEHYPQISDNDTTSSSTNAAKQTYISPSDTILSPCTARLNAVKGRRFAKANGGAPSLFASKLAKAMSQEKNEGGE